MEEAEEACDIRCWNVEKRDLVTLWASIGLCVAAVEMQRGWP